MPKEIKTRNVIKDIKIFDRAADVSTHMKNSVVKSKEAAERTQDTGYNSPSEYASDTISERGKDLAQDTAHGVKDRLKNPHKKAQENINKAKEHFNGVKKQLPKERKRAAEQAQKTADNANKTAKELSTKAKDAQKMAQEAKKTVEEAKRTLKETRQAGQQTIKSAKESAKGIKQADRTIKTAKQTRQTGGRLVRTTEQSARKIKHAEKTVKTSSKSIKTAGKSSIKAAKKSIKTAEKSAKMTVKTAQQSAKAAQKTAQASAKAAKAAAQAAKAATKAAIAATKAAVKTTIAMIKAAIAAIKGLVALIAAGGWIAVVVILIIMLIAMVVGSVFGIFFSGEDNGIEGGRMMPDVVTELTVEFYDRVEEIKNDNTHDILDMDVMSINWSEVLSVYAVKLNSDPDNPMEVATLDDDKVNKLRDILNDMVSLSHSTRTETRERTVTTTDADGNETETTETVSVTILKITMSQKSVDDMATQYGFNQEQKNQIAELLSPEYADMWAALLGGYVSGGELIMIGNESRVPNDIFSWVFVDNHSVTSLFGYREDPFTHETSYHGGIDIGAPEGTLILAAADGIVTAANSTDAWGGGYGYFVKVRHNETYTTFYAHCSKIAVTNGQEVKKGQVIGYVGTTGRSTGDHLHFEVYKDGVRTNPLSYFN